MFDRVLNKPQMRNVTRLKLLPENLRKTVDCPFANVFQGKDIAWRDFVFYHKAQRILGAHFQSIQSILEKIY